MLAPKCNRCGSLLKEVMKAPGAFAADGSQPSLMNGVICLKCEKIECSSCNSKMDKCSYCGGDIKPVIYPEEVDLMESLF